MCVELIKILDGSMLGSARENRRLTKYTRTYSRGTYCPAIAAFISNVSFLSVYLKDIGYILSLNSLTGLIV